MIISLTIRNFKSIKNETTLFLSADEKDKIHPENLAYPGTKTPILRTFGLWGPNASGKSNIFEALRKLRNFLGNSHHNNLGEPIKEYRPFRLDPGHKNSPTFFELDFITDQRHHFIYTIEYDREKIINESLELYTSAKTTALFTRFFSETGSHIKFSQRLDGKKNIDYLDNQSYLGKASNTPDTSKYLKEAYTFIIQNIIFINPSMGMFSADILRNDSYIHALSNLLQCADIGIQQVKSKEHNINPNTFPNNMPLKLKEKLCQDFKWEPLFYHNDTQEIFTLRDESNGTRRLYQIAPLLLLELSSFQSKVFLFDEIDCCLHPQIVKMIIFLFHDLKINSGNPQLLFTTHNTALMSSDYFRRDQIGLTQKNKTGATELTFLSEYEQVRCDTNFEKWYREGRFEAIPEVNYNMLRATIANLQSLSHHGGCDNE